MFEDWYINYKKEPKLEYLLVKYYARYCSRATPFGLFSSVGVIDLNDNNFNLNTVESVKLSFECILYLKDFFKEKKLFKQVSNFNSTLYKVGNEIRFFEKSEGDNYYLKSLKNNPVLNYLLEKANNNKTVDEVKGKLLRKGFSKKEIQELFAELEGHDFLNFDLVLDSPLEHLLSNIKKGNNFYTKLFEINRKLNDDLVTIELLVEVKQQLNATFSYNQKAVFYCYSTFNKTGVGVNKFEMNKLLRQLQELGPLNNTSKNKELNNFKDSFFEKFGEQKIPILKAFDVDFGCSYGDSHYQYNSALTENIESVSEIPESNKTNPFVLNKYLEFLKNKDSEIVIQKGEIGQKVSKNIATSYFAFGKFLIGQDAIFDLNAFGGSSAANLISRFSNEDEGLKMLVSDIAEKEDANGLLNVEVIHYNNHKEANVLRRPSFRNAELSLLAKTSHKKSIKLSEIFISVKNGQELQLTYKGQKVLPKLTNAYNYKLGLPLYKFLGDYQHYYENVNVSWGWGILAETEVMLPRVSYKNIILSKKTWNINFVKFKRIEDFIGEFKVPKLVWLVNEDKEILLNLENEFVRELINSELYRLKKVCLKEYIDQNLKLENKAVVAEAIVPFYSAPEESIKEKEVKLKKVKRKFLPLSEWNYLKIYLSPNNAQKLLSSSLVKQINKKSKKWFFIRYADPEFHLRIRFKTTKKSLLKNTLKKMNKDLKSGLIFSVQLDTYSREIEKYKNIKNVETLFHLDSKYYIKMLPKLNKLESEYFWLFLLKDIHLFVESCNLSQKEVHVLFFQLKEGVALNKNEKHKVNSNYRQHSKLIEDFLPNGNNYTKLEKLLVKKNKIIIKHKLTKELSHKAISNIIHMKINRWFPGDANRIEMVVYLYLEKYYKTLLKRNVTLVDKN